MILRSVLFLLLFFIIFGFAAADEWDIFDNGDDTDTSQEEEEKIEINSSNHVETRLNYTLLEPSLADQSPGGIKDIYYHFLYEFDCQVHFPNNLSWSFLSSFVASDKLAPGVENHSEYPTLGFSNFSITECVFEYPFTPFFQLELGIIPVVYGNNLIFNPVNYLNRIILDSTQPGSTSFPTIQTSFIYGTNILSLFYILYQEETFEFLNKEVPSMFQTNFNSHFFILESNHFILNNNITFLGFLELAQEEQYYTGLGIEILLPLADFVNISLQGLFSNGKPSYKADSLNDLYFLNVTENSEKDFFWDIYIDMNLTLFKLFTLKLGYLYNQRGLDETQYLNLVSSLEDTSNPLYTIATQAAVGFTYSPIPFIDHMAIAGILLPQLIKDFNGSIFAFISIPDFSTGLITDFSYKLNKSINLNLKSEHNLGAENSRFGLNSVLTTISFGIELFL